jgi:uncharacterized protein YpuA (DUF1002 family)
LSVFLFTWLHPSVASADAVVEETVVTLGHDLTQQERHVILNEMNVPNDSSDAKNPLTFWSSPQNVDTKKHP